ncbi:MAG TPA: hypothetical protein VFE85_06140 [Woeseiaceae bacterium]|nr:hypothetical protein [Woeseiaceae bacterium]
MQELIGDYRSFFADLVQRLAGIGIDIGACPLSHLALRTVVEMEGRRFDGFHRA